jgi:hypothetical protein
MGHSYPAHHILLITVASTTVIWIVVTYMTQPTERTKLLSFYRTVRPAGPGWESVRQESGLPPSPDSLPMSLLGWVLGCTFVYAGIFGTGSFLYGRTAQGMVWLVLFIASGIGLQRILPSLWQGADRVAETG